MGEPRFPDVIELARPAELAGLWAGGIAVTLLTAGWLALYAPWPAALVAAGVSIVALVVRRFAPLGMLPCLRLHDDGRLSVDPRTDMSGTELSLHLRSAVVLPQVAFLKVRGNVAGRTRRYLVAVTPGSSGRAQFRRLSVLLRRAPPLMQDGLAGGRAG
jgi:hypothetical protein